MPRTVRDIIDHSDELAKRFEDYQPRDEDGRDPEAFAALRDAVASRPQGRADDHRGDRQGAGERLFVANDRTAAEDIARGCATALRLPAQPEPQPAGWYGFNGGIADVAIYPDALTAGQVADQYGAG